jgi:DNA-directed RNA polymerase subunit RPC12/RpoP
MAQNQYTCDTCGEAFDTREELQKHERMMHSQYKCEVCGQTFDSEGELEAHNLAMHPERQITPRSS